MNMIECISVWKQLVTEWRKHGYKHDMPVWALISQTFEIEVIGTSSRKNETFFVIKNL